MKGTKVASIPHPLGTRSRETALAREHYQNERSWRPMLAEKYDRHHIETDKRLGILEAVNAMHPPGKGGTGLESYPTLRPMAYHVFAKRRGMWDGAKAAGIAIPELLDRPDSQRRGMLYDVLAVGAGVTSVKPGDCVVVNHCVAADRGDTLGEGVYEFTCDVEYVDRRTHETETERLPDGSRRTYQRPMSDTERRSQGDVLAVLTGEDE